MKTKRKISAEKKVEILRELLENSKSIAEIAEENGVHPNLIYSWKKTLFEGAVELFVPKSKKNESKKDREITKLKEKLAKRETAISELLQDNIELKKKYNGEY
jgi:transposase/putative transposase